MVTTYKKKTIKTWSPDTIKKAIDEHKSGKSTCYALARRYNIPEATLRRYIKINQKNSTPAELKTLEQFSIGLQSSSHNSNQIPTTSKDMAMSTNMKPDMLRVRLDKLGEIPSTSDRVCIECKNSCLLHEKICALCRLQKLPGLIVTQINMPVPP